MHVGARNGRANYFMEGTEMQAVSEEKDLGVVVDEKLVGILQQQHVQTGSLDF